MCTRYALTAPPAAVQAYFELSALDEFPPRYNIAPTQPVAIIRLDHRAAAEATLVRWGLIPSWVKDPREFATLIIARAETAAEKPSFRAALRHRRCLIPATGYYEWTGKTGKKTAHLVRPMHGEIFAIAGLCEHWIGADGSELETMAILTIAANSDLAPRHDRMPLLIRPQDFTPWLDCRGGSATGIEDLLAPPVAGIVRETAIGRAINNVLAEGPGLWAPPSESLL